jgi:hypothetical protein
LAQSGKNFFEAAVNPFQRNEHHIKEISKQWTIIIHLFTLTARFFTAGTTEAA